MSRVYVSGPMSLGNVQANVQRGIDCGNWLLDRGVSALVPHYSNHPQARRCEPGGDQYEKVIAADLEWVAAADAVIRLRGRSSGADRECLWARKLGIPVFTSRRALMAWLRVDNGGQTPRPRPARRGTPRRARPLARAGGAS